jgi:hypothetical protein
MQLAVRMLPFRLPSVLASVPNSIMPHMTPSTTVYVKDLVSDGRHVSNRCQRSNGKEEVGFAKQAQTGPHAFGPIITTIIIIG